MLVRQLAGAAGQDADTMRPLNHICILPDIAYPGPGVCGLLREMSRVQNLGGSFLLFKVRLKKYPPPEQHISAGGQFEPTRGTTTIQFYLISQWTVSS